MPEYRPLPEDREDEQGRILSYAFDSAAGPFDPERDVDEVTERRYAFGESYGLFDGDELLCCITHLPFTARVRGTWLPLGGVAGVATPPEHRRAGHVGALLEATLADYRDRGWPLAALRPFDESFYERYGWATGCRRTVGTVEPAALAPAARATSGSFHRVDHDDPAVLEPAYEGWLDGVTLATRRSEEWWRDRVLLGHEGELYCYAWRDGGPVRGYLVYDVASEGTLRTHEVAFADHEAYLNVLRFCRDHDSQVDEVALHGFGHDRLLDVVADRAAVTVERQSGHMVRIVDVTVALEAVPFPPAATGDLVLEVDDDHAPWNDDRFALHVTEGAAAVTRTDARPDARVSVGTLSQLLVGHVDPALARAAGNLSVEDPETVGALAALFPGTQRFLPETF